MGGRDTVSLYQANVPDLSVAGRRASRLQLGADIVSRPHPAPLTVVLVDDDLDFRLIVRALLRGLADVAVIVGEAQDGEQALALVRRIRPDILISDVIMFAALVAATPSTDRMMSPPSTICCPSMVTNRVPPRNPASSPGEPLATLLTR